MSDADEFKAIRDEAAAMKAAFGKANAALDRALGVLEKPYLDAARRGDVPALAAQLEKGARLLATDSCGNTALFFAAQYGHVAAVQFLLEKGIPLEVKNSISSTPLMGAAGHGHMDVAKLLVAKGADPFYRNATGMSAYGYARSAGRKEMMDFLLPPKLEQEAPAPVVAEAPQPAPAAKRKRFLGIF